MLLDVDYAPEVINIYPAVTLESGNGSMDISEGKDLINDIGKSSLKLKYFGSQADVLVLKTGKAIYANTIDVNAGADNSPQFIIETNTIVDGLILDNAGNFSPTTFANSSPV